MNSPQPFWTSKTFWSAFLAFCVLIYHMWTTHNWDPELIAASLMMVLATVFRWTSDQPLSFVGGSKNEPPPVSDPIKRLTKD